MGLFCGGSVAVKSSYEFINPLDVSAESLPAEAITYKHTTYR